MVGICPGEDRQTGTGYIGSFPDGPGQVLIVLRGDMDAATVDRLGSHLHAHPAGVRFLTIDASAVPGYDPGLLDLLGRTQRRLARRHGLLSVRGLHAHLLPAAGPPAVPAPSPASGDAGIPTIDSVRRLNTNTA